MVISIVLFLIGIAILVASTQFFVSNAERLSQRLHISPLIIGTTLVAVGTSIPELVVSVAAVFRHDIPLALGNIIGSNIVNILLVFPVGIALGKLRIGTIKTQRNTLLMAVATAVFVVIYFLRTNHLYAGAILLTLAVFVTIAELIQAVRSRDHKSTRISVNSKYHHFDLILQIVGIFIGGLLVVNAVEDISLQTGISTGILGLSLTAIATSLPELLTTVFSQENHDEKLTIGNIIGSNIYNLAFIGGIVLLFSSWGTTSYNGLVFLILSTAAFVFIIKKYKGKTIPRWIALILLSGFSAYIYTL